MTESSQNQAQKSVEFKFAQIPNSLIDAWLTGKISDPCFKLVTICLRHSQSFHVKYNYLHNHCGMHESTIKKAKEQAVLFNLLRVEKVREGRSTKVQFCRVPESEWRLDINKVTNSLLSHSEVSDSELSDSEVSYLKNTNLKKTDFKKTKFKNTNDDEEKIRTSSSSEKIWLSKRKPSELINECLNLKLIPTRKNGWVNGIVEWNKIAEELWNGKTDEQINEDLLRLQECPQKLPKNPEQILSLLLELKSPEPKFEANNGFESDADYQNYLLTVKDDMPF